MKVAAFILILSFLTFETQAGILGDYMREHELKPGNVRASNRKKVSNFMPEYTRRLQATYTTCQDGWNDVIFWLIILYGDSYANYGGNTLLYFLYEYAWVKLP